MHFAPPAKTQETKAFYQRVVARLERHAGEMMTAGHMAEIHDRNLRLALAYDDLEATVTAATARLYKAAAVDAITEQPGSSDYDAMQILSPEPSEYQSARQDLVEQRRASNLGPLRGAQQKAKWLPMSDWIKLSVALGQSESIWAKPACDWITATLLTGLRPCEWSGAKLVGQALVIQNAKATNGRAHSPTRTINLERYSSAERTLVASFLGIVHAFGEAGYQDLYNGVRGLVYVTARRTFPGRERYPTLYTARHCFAARAKATYNKVGVAALMGHASIETAGRHYALSRHAKGGKPLEVEPASRDIDSVRRAQAARNFLGTSPEANQR